MADTTFIDNSTVIVASWLNDINDTVYTGLGGEQTPSGIRTHLGLGTASQLDVGTTANKVVQLDGTAKLPAVDGSQLTGIVASVVDVTGATGTLPVAHGGTGATTAATARANLGSTTVGDAVFIAADAAAARTAIGTVIGTDVQAYNANIAMVDIDQSWTGSQRGTPVTDNDLSFDLNGGNNFTCNPSGTGTLTFTNHTAGQSGFIKLVNGSNYTISAAGTTKISSADLSKISATGTYILSYYDDGTNAYVVSSANLA